jgi:predicted naringenin-chalcone synthase
VLTLTGFVASPPRYSFSQDRALAWLAQVHARADAALGRATEAGSDPIEDRIARALAHVACPATQIAARGQSVFDAATPDRDADCSIYNVGGRPHGAGTAARTQLHAELTARYFADAYAHEHEAPDDLIHVTCTGYTSPSGAQQLVAARRWSTRVTHAYHMGCYAAIPAVRMAAGYAAIGSRRIDIVHTELCSLHLDPADHSLEQLVIQSLFADGLIRYVGVPRAAPGLRVLATHERLLPETAGAMSWRVGDHGMQMTLAREVPDHISAGVRAFVVELFERSEVTFGRLRGAVCAIHPGGPKIIDRVRDRLELDESQVAASRAVLRDHGNMSSATLPHIWSRVVNDPVIETGTLVPSLAFGPGLTMCGALLEKV